jgi:hypothetical protein
MKQQTRDHLSVLRSRLNLERELEGHLHRLGRHCTDDASYRNRRELMNCRLGLYRLQREPGIVS